ncbi:MAG: dTMP kinase [Micavibrio sp.]|nr:dTMP kinase [Micavibrio sp.]
MSGLFITFEGGEGSGKTTQINRLARKLVDEGHEVLTTREPGGTPEAEKIRNFLVQRDGGNWSPMAECLLLFAAREMHYSQIIKPALDKGKIVISDRFTDSTRIYQGYGHGLPLERIEQLKQIAIGDVEPKITFVLNINTQTGLARSESRLNDQVNDGAQTEDRFEKLGNDFHTRINQGFIRLTKDFPDRCVLIDASRTIEEIASDIYNGIKPHLEKAA